MSTLFKPRARYFRMNQEKEGQEPLQEKEGQEPLFKAPDPFETFKAPDPNAMNLSRNFLLQQLLT